MSRLAADLASLLRVRPEERRPLLWLTLYATAAIGGVLTVGFSISTALYLSQVPASATALISYSPTSGRSAKNGTRLTSLRVTCW